MDIEARKIEIIKQILGIDNERFIKEIEVKMLQLFPAHKSFKNKHPLPGKKTNSAIPPTIEIRENVSLNELVAEQQTISITYKEIRESTKKTKWKHSLKELLEALN